MPQLPPLILAIDTSCDDTSASVVSGRLVLSNVVASQTQLHKQYGGVFPTVAKQAHKENIQPTIQAALKRARINPNQLVAIAVTAGPGLAPALEVGIEAATKLAQELKIPLLPINHIEGHALSVLVKPRISIDRSNSANLNSDLAKTRQIMLPSCHSILPSEKNPTSLPILSLVISGGHSEFILIRGLGQYERLGWTQDDAAGEALDKFGRMLDLGYPAGATIEQFAKLGDPKAHNFPLPMTTTHDFHLSFSGLKTHARRYLENLQTSKKLTRQDIYDLCASFQYAIFRHIVYKMSKIIDQVPISQVWLGGGVAANITLRRMIRSELSKIKTKQIKAKKAETTNGDILSSMPDSATNNDNHQPQSIIQTQQKSISFFAPYTKKFCADNAAMIGVVASLHLQQLGATALTTKLGNLKVDRKPRWKIGEY